MSARGRIILVLLLVAGGLVAALRLDHAVFAAVPRNWDVQNDLLRMLRIFGYGGFWLVVAAALLLIDWRAGTPWRRAAPLTLAWVGGGLAAEVLKLLIRRLRPHEDHAGHYVFRAFSDRLIDTGGLGMPSSHTAVAFAAAWMLCRLHPGAAPVWILGAIGCGASRIVHRDHYLSDIYLAAVVGYLVAAGLWRACRAPKPTTIPAADPPR